MGALCPRNTPSDFNDRSQFLSILICMPNFNFTDRLASELNREVPKFGVGHCARYRLYGTHCFLQLLLLSNTLTCIQNRNFLVRLFSDIYKYLKKNWIGGTATPIHHVGARFCMGIEFLWIPTRMPIFSFLLNYFQRYRRCPKVGVQNPY